MRRWRLLREPPGAQLAPGVRCEEIGYKVPFSWAKMEALYGSPKGYVSKVDDSVDRLVKDRWLIESDVAGSRLTPHRRRSRSHRLARRAMRRTLLVIVAAGDRGLDCVRTGRRLGHRRRVEGDGHVRASVIQYSGTGSMNPTGQAELPAVRGRASRSRSTQRCSTTPCRDAQELVRIDDMTRRGAGGAGGLQPGDGAGGIRPIPGDIIQNTTPTDGTEAGAMNIWLTPHGFLKGAGANAATAKLSRRAGRPCRHRVQQVHGDRHPQRQNLVERVETKLDVSFTGDTLFERDLFGLQGLRRREVSVAPVMRQGGFPILDIRSRRSCQQPAAMEVGKGPAPRGRARACPHPGRTDWRGLWFLNSGAPQSILVEFKDYAVIIEGPSSDERTLATLAEAAPAAWQAGQVPDQHAPSRDHSAASAVRGRRHPIITHESHKRYYEQVVFRAPHTLNPDHLARSRARRSSRRSRTSASSRRHHDARAPPDEGHPHAQGLLMCTSRRRRC